MVGENGVPETPDWLPQSRTRTVVSADEFDALVDALDQPPKVCPTLREVMKRHAECSAFVSMPLTYEGDQA